MTDAPEDDRNLPETISSSVSGGVSLDAGQASVSGDVTGRDKLVQGDDVKGNKIVNYYQLDIQKLLDALRQALPAGDPTPTHLLEMLQGFDRFHTQLYEWKELHNALNDVIFVFDQFAREVERRDAIGQAGDVRSLSRLWRPVEQKVSILMEFAANIKYIGPPFVALPDGGSQGPEWAIELRTAADRVQQLFEPNGFDAAAVYDATYAFGDAAEKHMYLADKRLRDTAVELYNLSHRVLGSLRHDEV